MSNLNVGARGSFDNTNQNTSRGHNAVKPSDQNTIRKVLNHEDDDDIFDDDFSSSDQDEGQMNTKQNPKGNNKRHGSVRSISIRSSTQSQKNRNKRNVKASTNSANQLNRAASQNLYYMRAHNPPKRKQASSFQN